MDNEQRLIKRYLVWCYKTTKEELDRIDRYFTQAVVDEQLLKRLKASGHYQDNPEFRRQVEDFAGYMQKKTQNAREKKYSDAAAAQARPEYLYLTERLAAIEQAAVHFLGEEGRADMIALYEQEMTRRILEAREH